MAGFTLIKRASIFKDNDIVAIIKIKSKPGKWNMFLNGFPDAQTRDDAMQDLLNNELKYIEVI